MNPLTIAVNDYLNVAFTNPALKNDLLITAVTPSTVNGQKSYAVTAGGIVYTCGIANCTIREKLANGVTYWVLGA